MPETLNAPSSAPAESPRAAYQMLAERAGAVQPGATMSDELFAFAQAVAQMSRSGNDSPKARQQN